MSALSFHEVSFVDEGRRILDRISFDVPEGGRLAIVGPNGAGKTLLARLAGGLLRPTAGSIQVFGAAWTNVKQDSELRRRAGVGLAQGALLSDLTAAENVRSALGPMRPSMERRARVQVERALSDTGVEYGADRPVRLLSVGERRRVDLARIFVSNPELLILDDVLVGIDDEGALDLETRIDRLATRRRRALLWLGGSGSQAGRLAQTVLHLETGRLTRLERVLVQQPPP